MSDEKIVWSYEEMVEETAAYFEWHPNDCSVIGDYDRDDADCLIVVHIPTGRTSLEAGDGGRWHLDGTAYSIH